MENSFFFQMSQDILCFIHCIVDKNYNHYISSKNVRPKRINLVSCL